MTHRARNWKRSLSSKASKISRSRLSSKKQLTRHRRSSDPACLSKPAGTARARRPAGSTQTSKRSRTLTSRHTCRTSRRSTTAALTSVAPMTPAQGRRNLSHAITEL